MSIIQGAGGGKKSASMPDDTLRSRAFLQLIDAISEGPIEGVQDVLINRTPIANIKDSNYQVRLGMPDDETLNGFDSTESFVQVGTEIDWEIGPTIRTITDQTIDAVKIHMNLNTIYSLGKGGQMQTGSTGWRVDVKPAGGEWQEMVVQDLDNHKATSPVQFQHNITLPGSGPWDIRVRPRYETERDKVEERVQWAGYSTVINGKLAYPHTAVVGINLSAEHVGGSMPSRHYRVKGRKILVPSNYDPIARTYSGVWDGTFKRAWSNCPPWILYDMVENNIFGVRDHIDISTVNKWHLYTIAQYCDALVPSGYKDTQGNPTFEPRYTYNGAITDKKQALDAFRSITAVWRGMGFYSLSQLYTTADMPQDPAFIYGPSNVVDGRFEYSTSSVKARHSVVLVRFNDPNNLFEPAIEPVIDDKALKEFGWREKTLELAGCSSRSLAHRYGRWVIDTEHNETETVSFSVGLDSVHALPGEIIAVSDPRRVQARLTGRVVSVTNNSTTRRIVLDQPVPDGVSGPVTLRVQKTDGTLAVLTGDIGTNRTRINFTVANAPAGIAENAVYILSSAQVAPKLFRILSIDEETSSGAENVLFNITALEYDPTKFARVEQGIQFEETPTSLPVLTVNPPTDFVANSRVYTTGGQVRTDIEIGWTPPVVSTVREYRVYANTPTQTGLLVGTTTQNSITHSTFEAGSYQFRIVAVSYSGEVSEPLVGTFIAEGIEAIDVGVVTDLVNAATLQGGAVSFSGKDIRLSWRNMMRVSSTAGVVEVDSDDAIYAHTLLEFYHGGLKVRTQRVKGNSFIYTFDMNREDGIAAGNAGPSRSVLVKARVVDNAGRMSSKTSISLTNVAPAAITPDVQVEGASLVISWPASLDEDHMGYLVWVRNTGASVDGVTPTAVVSGNQYRFNGTKNTQYWVSVSAYDAFGKDVLTYATPISRTTTFNGYDLDPSVFDNVKQIAFGETLPATGEEDQLFLLTTENKLYRWTGTQWVAAISEFQPTPENFPQDLRPIEVVSALPTTGNFEGRVVMLLSDGNLYRFTSGAWKASINASQIEGQVSANQIADNAIGVAKFAQGLRPVEIVGSLPGTPHVQGRMVLLTTDNQIYRNTGSGWTKAVNATDISGQVQAAQIAGIAASQITGQLTDAQVAELSAAKLTGQIVASQIANAAVTTAKFASGIRPVEIVSALPTTGNFAGRVVLLTTNNQIYRHTGSPTGAAGFTAAIPAVNVTGQLTNDQIAAIDAAKVAGQLTNDQIAAIDAAKLTGQIVASQIANNAVTTAKFASGIRPVEILSTLPTSGNFVGRMVFLTTDNKLYRHTGSPTGAAGFTAATPAADITGQLTDEQIAAIDAAKLTGQITAPQIADQAITDAKIAGLAASKVTGQLTDEQVADLSAAKLTGQIAASQIANGAINTAKFASGIRPVEVVSSLPTTGNTNGRTCVLTTDGKLYRYHNGAWTSAVPSADIQGQLQAAQIASVEASKVTGQLTDEQIAAVDAAKMTGQIVASQIASNAITTAKFASGIRPVEVLSALPSSGNFAGRMVFLTTDNKLYRHTGSPTGVGGFTAAIPATDISGQVQAAQIAGIAASQITGQLTNAQIAALDAAKLTGQITAPQIADQAITDAKVAGLAASKVTGQLTNDQIAAVAAAKLTGQVVGSQISDGVISTAKFASGIRPIEIVSVLPTGGNFAGRMVFLTTDNKLYRHTGSPTGVGGFTAAVPAADISGQVQAAQIAGVAASQITGQLSNSQIASISAAKLTEQITATQISDSAISTPKLAAGAVEAAKIAAGAIVSEKIAANAITAEKIQAGAIETAKLAAGAIVAGKIATGAITAGKIATNAVEADNIAANAITAGKIAAGAVSATEIAAGAIVASKLAIGDATNAYIDYDMRDNSFYSSDGASYILSNVNNVNVGDRELRLNENGEAYTGWCSIDGDAYLRVRAVTRNTVADPGRIGTVFIEFASYNGGNITPTRREQVHQRSNSTSQHANEVDLVASNAEDRFRFVLVRSGATTGAAVTMAGLRVRKRMTGQLIVDGAITADKIVTNAITAGKIATGAVEADKIAANAVTANKIEAGAITTAKLAAGAVEATNIAAGAITTAKLAASAVEAGNIAAGAITAVKISAGAVETAKLAVGAVVADKIAANAITAEKIQTGAITTAKLAAGAVEADKIAAGAITTAKLAANAVEAGNIAAGAIVAGKIAAGAISASEIAAGAITASKLLITDINSILPNPDFSGDGWFIRNTGAITQTASGNNDPLGQFLRIAGNSSTTSDISAYNFTSVAEGDDFLIEFYARTFGSVTAPNISAHYRWGATDPGTAAAAGTFQGLQTLALTSEWQKFSVPLSVPAGRMFIRPSLRLMHTAGTIDLTGFRVYRRANSSLIVDGAITTDKLVANAITAEKIATDAITANKIAANAITTEKIQAGAIQAANIAAGAIQAGKIAADAVTTNAIAANAVTADQVAANAIVAGKIAAGAISATEISAGAIVASKLAIGDSTNVYPDYDMKDDSFYSSNGPSFSLATNGSNQAGEKELRLNANGEAYTSWCPVDPTAFIRARATSRGGVANAQLIGTVFIEFGSNNAGVVTPTRRVQVFQRSNSSAYNAGAEIDVSLTGAEDRFRFVLVRSGTYSGSYATMAGLRVRKRMTGELIVDGSITADKIVANAITSDKIVSSAITGDKIAANAITAEKIKAGEIESAKIAAGAIRTLNIASEAITADKIQANAVKAGAIEAGAITAVKIAAGAVETAKLAAGAITAEKIAANAITAEKIKAGEIVSGKLAANSVSASNIVAGAITAGKIAAGAVSATEIAAGAITASKLAIGDFSNIVPGNDMKEDAAWSMGAGWTRIDASGTSGFESPGVMRFTYSGGTGWSPFLESGRFVVEQLKPYFVKYQVWAAAGVTRYVIGRVHWFDATGAALPGSDAFTVINDTIGTGGETFGVAITPPNLAKYATIRFYVGRGATTGDVTVGSVNCRRMSSGELIVDGAITAEKLTASAVTTEKLAAGAVVADKIAANAITAVKISAGAVETAKLAAGAITAEKIASKAITTEKLEAGAVTATEIASSAITTDKIAANAITAGKIQAGAISADQIAASAVTASKLAIGDMTNVYPDYDMKDPNFYSSDGADYSLNNVNSVHVGDKELRLNANGEAYTSWCSVDYSAEIRARAVTRGGVASTQLIGTIFIEFGFYNGGNITPTRRVQVHTRSNSASYNASGAVDITVANSEDRFRFVLVRSGTYVGSFVTMAGLLVRKRMTGELIVDGAITAEKLVASAVTTDKLAANAVVAGKIAAEAITAEKIKAGAIETAKLAAGAVTANEIATGAIIAGKIATGAVEADKIAANAITAGKIAAGAVSATEIAAGAIIASKLAIADFRNMVPNGDFTDPYVSTSTSDLWWSGVNGTLTYRNDFPDVSDYSMLLQKSSSAVSASMVSKAFVSVEPGATYYASARFWTNQTAAAAGAYFRVLWFNKEKVQIAGGGAYTDVVNNRPFGTTPVEEGKDITAPAGAYFCRFQLCNHSTQTVSTNLFFGALRMSRKTAGELIVDGAITATKVAANAITAAKIEAGAVTADKLKANSVTTGKIAAGAVAADQIAANAITSVKIASNAITADKILAGAITTNKIQAGAISASLIAAGAIDSTHLTTGSLITQSAQVANGIITNAKIGAAIQSNNFVAGTSGWRIQKSGTAEFVNLIVRNSLVVGSVSDIAQTYLSSEYAWRETGWTQKALITLGAIDPTDLWTVHFSGQMRYLFGPPSGDKQPAAWLAPQTLLQRRIKIDGTWEAWTNVAHYQGNWTGWGRFNWYESIAGDFDDVQYQVQIVNTGDTSITGNNFRRFNISGRKIMR